MWTTQRASTGLGPSNGFKNSLTGYDKLLSEEKEWESCLWIMSTGFLAQALGPIKNRWFNRSGKLVEEANKAMGLLLTFAYGR